MESREFFFTYFLYSNKVQEEMYQIHCEAIMDIAPKRHSEIIY